MSDAPWDPQDGPPPTDAEREEARAVAEERSPLGDVAARVTATVHPDAAHTRAVVESAVARGVTRARPRWVRRNAHWLALAAAAAVLVTIRARVDDRRDDDFASITHAVTTDFDAPLPHDAQSLPIGRIADARMHAYRDALLLGGGGSR